MVEICSSCYIQMSVSSFTKCQDSNSCRFRDERQAATFVVRSSSCMATSHPFIKIFPLQHIDCPAVLLHRTLYAFLQSSHVRQSNPLVVKCFNILVVEL